MKINKLLLFSAVILISTSCSKDDDTAIISSPGSNEVEDVVLDANMVTSNFEVLGATIVQGTPPAANGSLDVQFSSDEQSAFLKSGFNIKFTPSANANVTGAYLQILNEDGSSASSYFDIASSSFGAGLTGSPDGDVKIFSAKNGPNDSAINVDFASNMTAGTFCYELCFYDSDGNISTPKEVCVEVENWGGFEALTGQWNLTKTIIDGEENFADEFDCTEPFTDSCDGGGEYTASLICRKEALKFLINEDGNFQYWQDNATKSVSWTESAAACEATYGQPVTSNSYVEGKWAYDEEEQTMTMVIFNGSFSGNSVSYENGELGYSGITTVSNTEMVVSFSYVDFLSGDTIDEVYYFSK